MANFHLSADERIRRNLLLAFSPRYVAEQADEVERVCACQFRAG
jgi:hypothetical protein